MYMWSCKKLCVSLPGLCKPNLPNSYGPYFPIILSLKNISYRDCDNNLKLEKGSLRQFSSNKGIMTDDTFLYFAYGSNLWSRRIHENNRSAVMKSVGLLKGYRLEFGHMSQRWRGASANILPTPGSHVYGILWELKKVDLEFLDKQEGVKDNIYKRVDLKVEASDGQEVSCMAYQIRSETREQSVKEYGEKLLPSLIYKNVIIKGAKENNLPAEYITFLENIPDNGFNDQEAIVEVECIKDLY